MRKKEIIGITVSLSLICLTLLALLLVNDDVLRLFYIPTEGINKQEVNSWNDTVIWKESLSFPEKLYLVPNEINKGYITDVGSIFVKGENEYVIWEYEDYSNLNKITLTADKTIIRVFVTHYFFESEELIFEFNTKTKKRRKYSIQQE